MSWLTPRNVANAIKASVRRVLQTISRDWSTVIIKFAAQTVAAKTSSHQSLCGRTAHRRAREVEASLPGAILEFQLVMTETVFDLLREQYGEGGSAWPVVGCGANYRP